MLQQVMLDLLAHHLDRTVRPYAGTKLLPGIVPGNFIVDIHVEIETSRKCANFRSMACPQFESSSFPHLPKNSPILGVFAADNGRVHANAIGQMR